MIRQYSRFKSQTPTDEMVDYTQTITKGFEFVPKGTKVTKLSITAETNLKLLVISPSHTDTIYLKEGTTWNIENDDAIGFSSIVCDNSTEAKVTYLLGYRIG